MTWLGVRKALLATLLVSSATGAVLDSKIYENVGISSHQARDKSWPYGPFNTKGRDIVDARGEKVTWAGINWPMSGKSLDWCFLYPNYKIFSVMEDKLTIHC